MSYSIIIFALFLIACLLHLKKVLEFLLSLLGLKDQAERKNYSNSSLLIHHCSEIMNGILPYNDPKHQGWLPTPYEKTQVQLFHWDKKLVNKISTVAQMRSPVRPPTGESQILRGRRKGRRKKGGKNVISDGIKQKKRMLPPDLSHQICLCPVQCWALLRSGIY